MANGQVQDPYEHGKDLHELIQGGYLNENELHNEDKIPLKQYRDTSYGQDLHELIQGGQLSEAEVKGHPEDYDKLQSYRTYQQTKPYSELTEAAKGIAKSVATLPQAFTAPPPTVAKPEGQPLVPMALPELVKGVYQQPRVAQAIEKITPRPESIGGMLGEVVGMVGGFELGGRIAGKIGGLFKGAPAPVEAPTAPAPAPVPAAPPISPAIQRFKAEGVTTEAEALAGKEAQPQATYSQQALTGGLTPEPIKQPARIIEPPQAQPQPLKSFRATPAEEELPDILKEKPAAAPGPIVEKKKTVERVQQPVEEPQTSVGKKFADYLKANPNDKQLIANDIKSIGEDPLRLRIMRDETDRLRNSEAEIDLSEQDPKFNKQLFDTPQKRFNTALSRMKDFYKLDNDEMKQLAGEVFGSIPKAEDAEHPFVKQIRQEVLESMLQSKKLTPEQRAFINDDLKEIKQPKAPTPTRPEAVEQMAQAEARLDDINTELERLQKRHEIVAGAEMEAASLRYTDRPVYKGQATILEKGTQPKARIVRGKRVISEAKPGYGTTADIEAQMDALQKERDALISQAYGTAMDDAFKGEEELPESVQEFEAAQKLGKAEEPQPQGGNRIFKERPVDIGKRMSKKLSRLSANPMADPELWADLVKVGGYYAEAGIREFGAWSQKMVETVGEHIRPHLEQLYQHVIQAAQAVKQGATVEEALTPAQKAARVATYFDEAEKEFNDKRQLSVSKLIKATPNKVWDQSYHVRRDLDKFGPEGKEVRMHFDMIKGSSGDAGQILTEAESSIYGKLNDKEKGILDRMIQSKAMSELSVRKPKNKLPRNFKSDDWDAYLSSIPKTISDKLTPRMNAFFDTMKSRLDARLAEGTITQEAYDAMKDNLYEPKRYLQHLDEPAPGFSASGKPITVTSSGIKALDEGSERNLVTDSRLLLRQAITRERAIEFKNRANVALLKFAHDNPENGIARPAKVVGATKDNKPVFEPTPEGYTRIAAIVDGRREDMFMPNEYAKEWIQSDPQMSRQFANFLQWATGVKVIKNLAVGWNPEFYLSFHPRMALHQFMSTYEYSDYVPKALLQMVRNNISVFKDAATGKGQWEAYVKVGGHDGYFMDQVNPLLPESIKGYVTGFGNFIDRLNRLSLYQQALRNGRTPLEAANIARGYLDFAAGGSYAKAADNFITFQNVAIQAARGLTRAAAEHPWRFAAKATQISMIAYGLYYANQFINPEAYSRIPDQTKVANWILTTPWSYVDDKGYRRHYYLTMPKEYPERIFTSVFEAMAARFHEGKLPSRQVRQAAQEFFKTDVNNMIVPNAQALLALKGYDVFRDDRVWKGQPVPATEQFLKDTPEIYKQVSRISGIPPENIRKAVSTVIPTNNIFATLVGGAYHAITSGLDQTTKDIHSKGFIANVPGIRRFLKVTPAISEAEREAAQAQREQKNLKSLQKRRGL